MWRTRNCHCCFRVLQSPFTFVSQCLPTFNPADIMAKIKGMTFKKLREESTFAKS